MKSFLLQGESKTAVSGVVLEDGTEIKADIVLSNATPKITFLDLLPKVNVLFRFVLFCFVLFCLVSNPSI